MDRDNREGMEQAIRGAEGLLELGLFTEAEAVFRQLAQEAPEHYRVWLGLARLRSRNFTQPDPNAQGLLERAASFAMTVDEYNGLKATVGSYAKLPPFAHGAQAPDRMPDVEQLEKLHPISVPVSSQEAVLEAREAARLKYLKCLLLIVVVIGLPTAFIVSCSNGVNPITNALLSDSQQEVPPPTTHPATTEAATEPEPEPEGCPYAEPTDTVKPGAEGEDVKWIQWHLVRQGAELEITGAFDEDTRQAVQAFQSDRDMKADGIVGEETREKLGE